MTILPEDVFKLLLAIVLGGLIGAEREYHDKAAGFRTMILICTGAALFTIFSIRLGGPNDAARIAAQIVSGVGFLGAGAIMRDAGRVTGLTTATAIWLAAALGMGVGAGYYAFASAAAAITLIVLWVFPKLERWITNAQDTRTYEIVCSANVEKQEQLKAAFRQCGLRVQIRKRTKTNGDLTLTWEAHGPPPAHERFVAALLADGEIKEFHC